MPSTANTTDHDPIAYNKLLNARMSSVIQADTQGWPSGRTQMALFGLISKIHTQCHETPRTKWHLKSL